MSAICTHCQGSHFSNQCPVWPQFCTNCNEEHPYGTECYQPWRKDVEEDTSEIDARIAREEALKREVLRSAEKALMDARKADREADRLRKAKWRAEHRSEYNDYQKEYMRKRRSQ